MKSAVIVLSVLSPLVGLVGCGPTRHHVPAVDDIGARPRPDQEWPVPSWEPSRAEALTPAPEPIARPPAPPPVGTPPPPPPAVPPAVPPGSLADLVDEFAQRVSTASFKDLAVVAVLPPFHLNNLFHRWEVSRLGDELAGDLLARFQSTLAGRASLVSPEKFRDTLRQSNRSLADIDSPEAAVRLAARVGARYLVRGRIEDSGRLLSIQLECLDVLDVLPLVESSRAYRAEDPRSLPVYRRFRDDRGEVIPGTFRIGALADPETPSLRTELQLIVSDAVDQLFAEGSAALKESPVAVLPTQIPGEIRFQNYQRALQRAILREKNHHVASGLDESRAMSQGPVRILGRTFRNLREAQDYALEKDLDRKMSDQGELRDTFSRIIFDIAEELGERSGIRVLPHDQLIGQAVLFSNEELERIGEGILGEETKKYFKTRGAGALIFSEFLESGDGFELVFHIRRLEDLGRLTGKVRRFLEPRFAVELRQYLK